MPALAPPRIHSYLTKEANSAETKNKQAYFRQKCFRDFRKSQILGNQNPLLEIKPARPQKMSVYLQVKTGWTPKINQGRSTSILQSPLRQDLANQSLNWSRRFVAKSKLNASASKISNISRFEGAPLSLPKIDSTK